MRLCRPANHGFRVVVSGRSLAYSRFRRQECYHSLDSGSHLDIYTASCVRQRGQAASPLRIRRTSRLHQIRSLHSSRAFDDVLQGKAPVLALGGRTKLSDYWIPPTQGRQKDLKQSTTSDILERYGFYYSAYAGIFHFLPLGLRILEKLQQLIRTHMRGVGASEVSLSSLSSVDLWKRSGRHELVKDELFHLTSDGDRRFLLAPTHEEEITQIVAKLVGSDKDLPLRLFQISRKYRDELRPRGGLLRAREFIMKDLYTFDDSENEASKTYESVYNAYSRLFEDLKLPIHAVAAQTGAMGGALSHEFQIESPKGDDEIISCSACGYGVNAEDASVGIRRMPATKPISIVARPEGHCLDPSAWDQHGLGLDQVYSKPFISSDGMTLVIAITNKLNESRGFNAKEIDRLVKLDTSIGDPYGKFMAGLQATSRAESKYHRVVLVTDDMIDSEGDWQCYFMSASESGKESKPIPLRTDVFGSPRSLLSVQTGDDCNQLACREACRDGTLRKERSIELAHTFNLGTRYSSILNAHVARSTPGIKDVISKTPMQMGCYGIGLTRLVGAVAELKRDDFGLRWPRLMAPFEVLVLRRRGFEEAAEQIYDRLMGDGQAIDCVIDNRDRGVGERYEEAHVVGYPLIIDAGKGWEEDKTCIVTYRSPNQPPTKVHIALEALKSTALGLLAKH